MQKGTSGTNPTCVIFVLIWGVQDCAYAVARAFCIPVYFDRCVLEIPVNDLICLAERNTFPTFLKLKGKLPNVYLSHKCQMIHCQLIALTHTKNISRQSAQCMSHTQISVVKVRLQLISLHLGRAQKNYALESGPKAFLEAMCVTDLSFNLITIILKNKTNQNNTKPSFDS